MSVIAEYSYLLIGLFALPEVIDYYMKQSQALTVRKADQSTITKEEFKRSLPSIPRGSVIGVIIGAIPGAGATAAAFLSHGEARRASRTPERFGKGAIKGVAAAEAENNGVAGATFIPLLSLGMPGDVVTAAILGAFMLHGLTPGPLMFEQNLGLIYALFIGILLN